MNTFPGFTLRIYKMTKSINDSILILGFRDGSVKICNIEDISEIYTIDTKISGMETLKFINNEQKLAVGDVNGNFEILNISEHSLDKASK